MSHVTLCPAIAFNKIVGGRYKLHILCVLHRGPLRFGEIGRSLVKGGLGSRFSFKSSHSRSPSITSIAIAPSRVASSDA
ncbi:hypothetical protein L1965_14290 [Paracoccus sp. EGI L200073]|nr:hypothetical protein [Paracoccus salsus]